MTCRQARKSVQLDLFYDDPKFIWLIKSCMHKRCICLMPPWKLTSLKLQSVMPIILVILSNATIVFTMLCDWHIPVVSPASLGPEGDLAEGKQNWLHVFSWKCCQCPILSQRRKKGAKKLQSAICASIYYMSNISKVHLTIHASFIYCPCGEKKISKNFRIWLNSLSPHPQAGRRTFCNLWMEAETSHFCPNLSFCFKL